MTEFSEIPVLRVLNPTSIDLGEFVINPFIGCQYACLYCYVRSNKAASRKAKPWGEFVEIRMNAPEMLEKELSVKKPGTVLLGSTTECFQPAEMKYQLTRKILEILNRHKVFYVILSRSPYIVDYLPLLKEGFCRKIYFTVNSFSSLFKARLEPRSPDFQAREEAVNKLLSEGVPVIPYFSPLLPWVSEPEGVFSRFEKAEEVDFECLNLRLNNINEIIKSICEVEPRLKENYARMLSDKEFYDDFWKNAEINIQKEANLSKKRYNLYKHNFGDYFKNSYT